MPTDRFLRLSEEKKQKIVDAAVKEFARVPFEEVSINKIIRGAEISRGSFYTYFQDKDDLLEFLMKDVGDSSLKYCLKVLSKMQGDIFMTTEVVYNDMLSEIKQKEQCKFYEHMISGIQTRKKSFFQEGGMPESAHEKFLEVIDEMYEVTDKSRLKIKNKEEYRLFLELLTILMFKSLGKLLNEKKTEAETREELKKSLEVLKYGVYNRAAE